MDQTNYQNNKLLTPTEVSTLLGVKTSTVYAWISRKELRSLKIDNRRFIPLASIHELYASRQSGEFVDHTYANGPVR